MRLRPSALALGLAAFALPATAQEGDDLFTDWNISGSLTVKLEDYSNRGDPAGSPYTPLGTFHFVETDVRADRRLSEFETLDVHFSGVAADNPFRINLTEAVAERATLNWEKGDAAAPFRLSFGDFFAFTTLRTAQVTLKGAQFELQPDFGGDIDNSFQVFAGLTAPTYNQIDFEGDEYLGASWLMRIPDFGDFVLSGVGNYREDDPRAGFVEREQHVVSLATEHQLGFFDHSATLNTELAWFDGDSADGAQQNDDGLGFFAQLRGKLVEAPITYTLRFEEFDNNYRPNAAAVTPGRRLAEARGVYRFDDGLSLRARAQYFRTGLDTSNHTDNFSAGLGLAGPMDFLDIMPNLTGSLDYSAITADDESNTVRNRTHSFTANFSAPLDERTSGRFGALYQNVAALAAETTNTYQLSFGVDHRYDWEGITGSISPGFTFRHIDESASAGEDYTPSVGLTAAYMGVDFAANYSLAIQQRSRLGRVDLKTHNLASTLSYADGPHRIGLELDVGSFQRETMRDNSAYRFGAFYTLALNKPAGEPMFAPGRDDGAGAGAAPRLARRASAGLIDIAVTRPNGDLLKSVEALALQGATGGLELSSDLIVYETVAIDRIDERQRIALLHSGPRLRKAALVIDVIDPQDARGLATLFAEVREALIAAYGAPLDTFERGDFAGDILARIQSNQLIRLVEWRTTDGILRLGIPRRLDGQVRIELQHARSFPPPSQTLWSINELR